MDQVVGTKKLTNKTPKTATNFLNANTRAAVFHFITGKSDRLLATCEHPYMPRHTDPTTPL
jgi:hypothetical protein